MSDSKILETMKKLALEIERYDYYYYSKNQSLISDVEYDKIVKELENYEKKYPELTAIASPTKTVGSSLKDSKFSKVPHRVPMLSLSNTYNMEEITDFINRIEKNIDRLEQKPTYDLELKLDGLSISIIYKDGRLHRAITRGDGTVGEDVTENILEIESVAKFLNEPISLEVRGEIVMPLSSFEKLNAKRLERGEEIFANPRNAAAGTLRQLDHEIVRERELDGYFYFLVEAEKYGMRSHKESLEYLEKLGIKTTKVCENLDNIEKIEKRIKYWHDAKEKLDYETDGLVLKVDELELWDELGFTAKSPRWAVAFKFPAKQVTTKLLGITWQVGRTGKVTPVAELQEVEVSGSKVKRASLHNYDEIIRKEIMIGDTVFVEKAAEIIPQVVMPVKELRDGTEKNIELIENCPECGTKLVKDDELVDYRCPNNECPAKIRGAIEYFVSRDGMNISGFGIKFVEKFIEAGILHDVADIYELKKHRDIMINMDKMGEKSIDKLLDNIEKSRERDYSKVIYSLGIPSVGKSAAKILAKVSGDIDSLMAMDIEELCTIDGVGEKSAREMKEFFENPKNIERIERLREAGLNLGDSLKEIDDSSFSPEFQGKTFLFTGKLNLLKRDEAQNIVETLGGSNAGSVNKKLNYLVVGEDAGSKLEKAKSLGSVKILTEEEFLELTKKK